MNIHNVNDSRKEILDANRSSRYKWAIEVDPKAVKAFEAKAKLETRKDENVTA